MRAKCFSPEDRLLLAERVRKNETGIQNKEFKARTIQSSSLTHAHIGTQWYQLREAVTDPIVLCVTLISVRFPLVYFAERP